MTTRSFARRTSRFATLLLIVLLVLGDWALTPLTPVARVAQAAELTVGCPGGVGDNAGLIAALNTANSTPTTSDTIILAANCTYTLNAVDNDEWGATGLPQIVSPVTIDGNGATITRNTSFGAAEFRFFAVGEEGALTVDYLTLTNGLASINGATNFFTSAGGAILNNGGSLTVRRSTLANNSARIFFSNFIDISLGGGLASLSGDVTIEQSTLTGNEAVYGAGFYYAGGFGSRIRVENTTISGNNTIGVQAGYGGGIYGTAGTVEDGYPQVEINAVTITNNSAGRDGGGVAFGDFNAILLTNSIIAGNSDLDPAWFGSTPDVGSSGSTSIYALNNIIGYNTLGGGPPVITDPLLGPLADNGGPTRTHLPLAGSPAINNGTANQPGGFGACPLVDQRGVVRSANTNDDACSSGAIDPTDVPVIAVTSTSENVANDGVCTLREAIIAANSGNPSGAATGECIAGSGTSNPTLLVLRPDSYTLSSVDNTNFGPTGLPVIASDLEIRGNGATIRRSSAGGTPAFRLFTVHDYKFTLDGVTLENGLARGADGSDGTLGSVGGLGWGGAILLTNFISELRLHNSTLRGNSAQGGTGGVGADGDDGFAGGDAQGGALYIGEATFAISNSTFSDNSALGGTGGAAGNGGSAPGATGRGQGGAMYLACRSDQPINSSTFSGNSASGDGGALFVRGCPATPGTYAAALNGVTISNNSTGGDGGGIGSTQSLVRLANSIVAGNDDTSAASSRPDLAGSFVSGGYNLVGDGTGASGLANGTNGDRVGTNANPIDPLLGPLQNNGGATQTRALLGGSPAIGNGNPAAPTSSATACTLEDQRGTRRPQAPRCAIGAFEPISLQTGPVFTVNTADDPGGPLCAVGSCSLRAAIHAANERANSGGPDQIRFNIPGTGVQTITLESELPVIYDAVVLDAATQPGYTSTPLITLDLLEASNPRSGIRHEPQRLLTLEGQNSTLRGLRITRRPEYAIFDTFAAIVLSDDGQHRVENNVVGDADDISFDYGMVVGSTNNTVVGNRLLGREMVVGILVQADNNRIIGNEALGAQLTSGVSIDTSSNNIVQRNRLSGINGAVAINEGENNLIGGLDPADGNLLSSTNPTQGIGIVSFGLGHRFLSNVITGNPDDGIFIFVGGAIAPTVFAGVPVSGGTRVQAVIDEQPNTTYTLQFFANPTCPRSATTGNYFGEGKTLLGTITATTDLSGTAVISQVVAAAPADEPFLTGTATSDAEGTSTFSLCTPIGPANDSWDQAYELDTANGFAARQFLASEGQTRWYKFRVRPNMQTDIALSQLPGNYDLAVYNDIQAAYSTATTATDSLLQQQIELEYDAIDSANVVTNTLDPALLEPAAFAALLLDPVRFRRSILSLSSISPSRHNPSRHNPSRHNPSRHNPSRHNPSRHNPSLFYPDSPYNNAAAYASAVNRSQLDTTIREGSADRGLAINSWNNEGYFYVSVSGRNGDYDPGQPFVLRLNPGASSCEVSRANLVGLGTLAPTSVTTATTIFLTDFDRMAWSGTAGEIAAAKQALRNKLLLFAARPEVKGVVIDVSQDATVARANQLADGDNDCPYAKNLVADAIKGIVERTRARNGDLQYVVLVGGDDVLPFYRYPDQALLGNESGFKPPVLDDSASQAALRQGYALGQDEYGTDISIPFKTTALAVPRLAVGRLVETATEVTTMLDAYIAANGIITPTSSLVTGYDFLEDAARGVERQLSLGTNRPATTLIVSSTESSQSPASWTAADLERVLLRQRNDVVFLAGHFSDGDALAADYKTSLLASQVASATVDLTNTLLFSTGCHSGYSTPDRAAVAGKTLQPDWSQAFARKGVTLIGGTGYQYGDTEFAEFSEELYINFAQQLRLDPNPSPLITDSVTVGAALVNAKQQYLIDSAKLRALDLKSLTIASLYGLPMLRVFMPGQRLRENVEPSIIGALNSYASNPGQTLALRYADATITPTLALQQIALTDVNDVNRVFAASYLSGTDGVVANPAEPVLPLERRNISPPAGSPRNLIMRGVGWRGGVYTDIENVLPLLGAPATELRGVQMTFPTDSFFPQQPWSVNYYSALLRSEGVTRLMLTPAQFIANSTTSPTGTLRRYGPMNFRFFYSANTQRFGAGIPALTGVPAITAVTSTVDITSNSVFFQATVTGDPSAGIQEVWVTYTGVNAPFKGRWQSLDLNADPDDSRIWRGTLSLPTSVSADGIRFVVQAASGVGLVAFDNNRSYFYRIGVDPAALPPSTNLLSPTLTLLAPPTSGAFGSRVVVRARLTNGTTPLADRLITLRLGAQQVEALSDALGVVSATLRLLDLPGSYRLRAVFDGDNQFRPNQAAQNFTLTKQATALALAPSPASLFVNAAHTLTATLTAGGQPLVGRRVVFNISGAGGSFSRAVSSDVLGRVPLGALPLGAGSYTVAVAFEADERYNGATANAPLTLGTGGGTPQKISPVLECVVDRGASWATPATRYVARFGYNNPNAFPVVIAVGSNNRFTPNPQNRGQTTTFQPGRLRFVFDVPFSGSNLVWTLNGKTSTASSGSKRC